MKQFLNLLKHELRTLFFSPATYTAAVLFLFLIGFIFLIIIESYSKTPHEALPLTELFRSFWIPVFFITPLLTMKSFAEERRMGTLETLMTTPVTPLAVVISKFLGAYTFYMIIWGIAMTYPLIIGQILPNAVALSNLTDSASIIGGYAFIALSGTLYLSLGIFASSLTRSQLVAGMFCFTLLFICLIGGRILLEAHFLENSWLKVINLDYFQTFQHLEDFSRGIVDSRPFFFYIGNSILVLGITSLIVESRV